MITSTGIGSGLDIESIIGQLMAIERQPLNNITEKQEALDVEISAIGSLRSALSDLENSAAALGDDQQIGIFVAQSSDEDVFTAEASPDARLENHDIEVISLAQAHQLASEAYAGGGESTIASGTYDFGSGDESFQIEIDATNNTLFGLRDAINESTENTSISASVLNLEGGSRLILSARNSGTDFEITTSSGLFTEVTAAADASLIIDGFAATSSSNEITDIIPGITLNLKAPGTAKLETDRDSASYQELMNGFVSSYNSVLDTINRLSLTDLPNDSTLRTIQSDLREVFIDPISINDDEDINAFELGLSFDQGGRLVLNETAFQDITTTDTITFLTALTQAESGFSARVQSVIERHTDAEGSLSDKRDAIDARRDVLDQQAERFEYRLEQTEARLRRQFTALDSLVSQLQATSSYLSDQLGSLSANNGG